MTNQNTLWMGDIEPWMNESFIMKSFFEFGFKPQNVNIIIDKRITKNRNFCFVKFRNVEEANNALFKLNGKKIPKINNYFKLYLQETCQIILLIMNYMIFLNQNILVLYLHLLYQIMAYQEDMDLFILLIKKNMKNV